MTRSVTDNEAVWRNLMRLADRLSSTGVTDCDLPSRLPLSQLRVVGVIYDRHPAGVMLKDIADELKLTPGAISQTVDVLVRENLVERTTSPTDRRAILLRPSTSRTAAIRICQMGCSSSNLISVLVGWILTSMREGSTVK